MNLSHPHLIITLVLMIYPISFKFPGRVLISPGVIDSTNGTMVTFTCEVEGGLNNVFEWRYSRTGDIVSNTSTLTLISSAAIGGNYLCEASNGTAKVVGIGTLNGMEAFLIHLHYTIDSIHFLFLVAPIILEEPQDAIITYLNESVRLYCTVSGFPVPIVFWRLGMNFYLVDLIDKYYLYSMPNSSFGQDTMVLEISIPDQSDTGNYTCVATSPYFDRVESEPALVLVQGN